MEPNKYSPEDNPYLSAKDQKPQKGKRGQKDQQVQKVKKAFRIPGMPTGFGPGGNMSGQAAEAHRGSVSPGISPSASPGSSPTTSPSNLSASSFGTIPGASSSLGTPTPGAAGLGAELGPEFPTSAGPIPAFHSVPAASLTGATGSNLPFKNTPLRVSDNERTRAINLLGQHWADGRLTMDEYEERTYLAASARTAADLNALFTDLPLLAPTDSDATDDSMLAVNPAQVLPPASYGRNIRLGLLCLSAIVAGAIAIGLNNGIWMLIVAVVYVLLYILKVGPESWQTSSRLRTMKQMERDRIRMEERKFRLEQRQRKMESKKRRRMLADQATDTANNALGVANTYLKKMQNKRS